MPTQQVRLAWPDIESLRDGTQLEWQDSCITDSTSMNYKVKRQSMLMPGDPT